MTARDLTTLLAEQHDLLTPAQAHEVGLGEEALRWRLHEEWRYVLPRVIQAHPTPLTPMQRRVAALLYAGPLAVISGAEACAWYGLTKVPTYPPVDVLVPQRCAGRRREWVHVRRTTVPFDVYEAGPLRFPSPARAVVEAARLAASVEAAEALVIEAVQTRTVRLEALVAENHRLGQRGSWLATRAIATAAGGAWSVPEAALGRLVRSSRLLPEMWANPELRAPNGRRLTSPDGWFDDVALAVMVHSRRYHDGAAWAGTVEKDGDLVAHGARVVGVAPTSLEKDPRRTLARIEAAYVAARSYSVRPPIRAQRRAA